jgi:hypothetical protein
MLVGLVLLVTSSALAQQDHNLYFQAPDGSINVIVPGGPGYVISPFPMSPSPSYPPAPYYGHSYSTPAQPYCGGDSSRSYQYEYQRGGPAGCVYGCAGSP